VAVIAAKTEPRCKLCRHPERAAIDALLEVRSNRGKDADGNVVNLDYVLAKLAELGVENPTEENCKTHWKRHCEVVTQREVERQEEVFAEAIERFNGGERVDPDELLEFVIFHGKLDAESRLLQSGTAGITIDQALKAVDGKTKRKHNEAQTAILGALGEGLSRVFAVAGPDRPALAAGEEPIDVDEVIEEGELAA
jgi:hypothetical protein